MRKLLGMCLIVAGVLLQGCVAGGIFPPEDPGRMAEIRRLERDVEHAMQTHDLERAADSIDQMIARLRPGQPPMTSQEEYTLHMSMVRTGVLRAGDVGHPVVRVLRARSAEIETRLMQGVSDPAEIGVLYTISLHGSLHGALRRVMDASVHEDRIAAQFHGDRLLRRRLQSHYRRLGHEQLAQRLGPTLGDVMEDGVRLALSIPGVVITLPVHLIMMFGGGKT